MIAVAVGGGIILLQVASHKGYIKINWNKLEKDANKAIQGSSNTSALDKVSIYFNPSKITKQNYMFTVQSQETLSLLI